MLRLCVRSILAAVLLVFGLAVPSQAQTTPIDSYQIKYYAPGATTPLQQTDVWTAAAVQCNQAPIATTNTVNPSRVVWDDPVNTGRKCVYTFPTIGSSLFALPVGSYEATLIALNTAGASAESNRAPFSRAAAPNAPVGFSLTR